jgi:hypothetical protein
MQKYTTGFILPNWIYKSRKTALFSDFP